MSRPAVVRLLTLGDSGAGKSSLLLQYTANEFTSEWQPTIGIDFRLKTVEVNGRSIKVQVWDTAGQERFRTITHSAVNPVFCWTAYVTLIDYYRGAHGICLVYDVTNEQSFNNIRKWISDVQTYAEANINIVLLGNKCDMEEKRVISTNRGEELAKEFNISFFETSAKTNVNVQTAFDSLVKAVCHRVFTDSDFSAMKKAKKTGESDSVDLHDGKTKRGCC